MVEAPHREQLVSGLVRIGEKEMTGEDEAEVDAYFAPDFRFHGPDGRELDQSRVRASRVSARRVTGHVA
jgi:hypothetical protein